MTEDATSAFAPLAARAAAMGGATPPDRLSLRDHIAEAEIGAFHEERGAVQRLRFSIVAELSPRGDAADDVDRILSYDRLIEAIDRELAAERLNLVETLAERIATRLLAHPEIARVFVRIEKLDRGPGALGVEIVRSRQAAQAGTLAVPGMAARVHLIATEIPDAEIALITGPAIIVPVPAAGGNAVPAATASARLRIALLGIEQAAWSRASAQPGASVVASRTELDWALAQGKSVYWAPAKLALDSPGAPTSADPGQLASWLAEVLGVAELVVHGDVAVPAGCRVPVARA